MNKWQTKQDMAFLLLREGVGPGGEIPLAVGYCATPGCNGLHMLPLSVQRLGSFGLEHKKAGFCKTAEKHNSGDVGNKVRVSLEGVTFCLAHPQALLDWPLRLPVAVD